MDEWSGHGPKTTFADLSFWQAKEFSAQSIARSLKRSIGSVMKKAQSLHSASCVASEGEGEMTGRGSRAHQRNLDVECHHPETGRRPWNQPEF